MGQLGRKDIGQKCEFQEAFEPKSYTRNNCGFI
jgi:hypothetical protein